MKSATEIAFNISKDLVTKIPSLQKELTELDDYGENANNIEIINLVNQFAPIISNAIYATQKEVAEEERFLTLIKLSREFTDDEMFRIKKALGYSITK